ncbi:hypothetical protein HU200_035502 [Digitaria exilis]|uniref:LOB domain-containing protein n=1 Tax=Digitaria exilis TaxID=1010633 RepID=A0A835BG49_9POAL|nr:hypothetical protein HU200_035502 [Digitaria exilis]
MPPRSTPLISQPMQPSDSPASSANPCSQEPRADSSAVATTHLSLYRPCHCDLLPSSSPHQTTLDLVSIGSPASQLLSRLHYLSLARTLVVTAPHVDVALMGVAAVHPQEKLHSSVDEVKNRSGRSGSGGWWEGHPGRSTTEPHTSRHTPSFVSHSQRVRIERRSSGTRTIRSMAAAGGGGAGSSSAACAACKYQRRRCTRDCPLAEFFPHDRPRVFRNAHRLFGVANILRTLARAGPDPERRREAMHCIIYESQAWEINPSAGCVPLIRDLQLQIRQADLDLRRVYDAIHAYRSSSTAAAAPESDAGDPSVPSSSSTPPSPPFQLLQPVTTGNNNDGDEEEITAEAYGGGGGLLPPFMFCGDGYQQQTTMSAAAAASDDDGSNIPLQTQPWTAMMQPPSQDGGMASATAAAVADMAGKLATPQLPQQDDRFLVDATTMATRSEHLQLQQLIPIQPGGGGGGLDDDDDMNYFADDGMDDDSEMAPESTR